MTLLAGVPGNMLDGLGYVLFFLAIATILLCTIMIVFTKFHRSWYKRRATKAAAKYIIIMEFLHEGELEDTAMLDASDTLSTRLEVIDHMCNIDNEVDDLLGLFGPDILGCAIAQQTLMELGDKYAEKKLSRAAKTLTEGIKLRRD